MQIANTLISLPLPYYQMDSSFQINTVSIESTYQFPNVSNFLDLVDPESRKKAIHFLNNDYRTIKIELNLRTLKDPLKLFDVFVKWENEKNVHVICVEKDRQVEKLLKILRNFEQTLMKGKFELLEQKEELEQSIKEMKHLVMNQDNLAQLGKLSARIAHEIRNPLTSVRGFLQLMKPYLQEIDKEQYADIALEEIDRASDIIYKFLNASKLPVPTKELVSVPRLLQDVVTFCQSEALIHNIEVTYKHSQILTSIWLDKKQIKQVLLNIIKNAMDAILEMAKEERGKILVVAQQTNENVLIKIIDNGIGMDKETVSKLFKPFFTTKEKGTGIGLAVCEKIISSHDGEIKVQSKVGEGTTFEIYFPLNI
jgi:signal transduction histidine kinase